MTENNGMYSKAEDMRRTVIVAEDEPTNLLLLGGILSIEYNVLSAENGAQALKLLKENSGRISMLLTDLIMPEMNGFELIRTVKSDPELEKIPIIVLTSSGDAKTEVECLRYGAVEFLPKPYGMPATILARVQRIIELSEDKSIIKATEKDLLTGLYTNGYFLEYASRLEEHHHERDYDALVLNIDRIKTLGDLYGEGKANRALQIAAREIISYLEKTHGIGSRFNQNTFYLLCEHQDSYDSLIQAIEQSFSALDTDVRLSLRLGVLQHVGKEVLQSDVLGQFMKAAAACGSLKPDGPMAIGFYDEKLAEQERLRESLLKDFDQALEQRQFVVFYQPKFSIEEKPVLRSAEALVRWIHPERGMVSPGIFIPLLEQNGLIQKLDNYVWEEAARQEAAWKERYGISIPISVNVSRIDLYDPHLVQTFCSLLERFCLKFDEYLLEITESAYSSDMAQMLEVIGRLKTQGFRIEMDDFGSGYSSLTRLTDMPIDVIKLDMSFIRGMEKDGRKRDMVELIIAMAKKLQTVVVAEGVELEEQFNILKNFGCDVAQGYYFSKPVPAEEFGKFIEEKCRQEGRTC